MLLEFEEEIEKVNNFIYFVDSSVDAKNIYTFKNLSEYK